MILDNTGQQYYARTRQFQCCPYEMLASTNTWLFNETRRCLPKFLKLSNILNLFAESPCIIGLPRKLARNFQFLGNHFAEQKTTLICWTEPPLQRFPNILKSIWLWEIPCFCFCHRYQHHQEREMWNWQIGFLAKYVRHHQSWSVSSGELISVIIGVQMFHLLSACYSTFDVWSMLAQGGNAMLSVKSKCFAEI